MTNQMPSAPTPEYGAPNLPITTTRRTVMSTAPGSNALEIPDFDRTWHPNEITEWLDNLAYEDDISEADLARAHQAVSEALGIED